MAKPVKLKNGREWPTRTAALAHFKEMLGRFRVGDEVPQGPDHEDLTALLCYYDRVLEPGAQSKVGVGVAKFSKGRIGAQGYSTECFFVHRIDGSEDDFSYINAVKS